MKYIDKLIEANEQKSHHLKTYLTLNEVAMDRIRENNVTAVKELVLKKKALITSINVIDDKIIETLSTMKKDLNISDISELSVEEVPELVNLKEIATAVLRQMVDVKQSDEKLFEKMEGAFEDYKNEKGKFDKRKLQYYTKNYFV